MNVQVTDRSSGIMDDFRKVIKPHKVQEDFLRIPDDVFEALYGGAAYGGKSWILTMLPLFRGFYKHRGFKGIILRRTFPDLEREIIRLSQDWYPRTGGRYNEQKHSWFWPEYGSYVDFGHVKNPKDIKNYDSSQYNYCAFDELTHFPEDPYVYMMGSRVRPSSNFKIAIVRNGTNPGGIGQTFVYNRFVKACPEGYKILQDRKTVHPITGEMLKRIFIPAFLTDNPYGMEYDPMYAQKLENLPEADKKAKKYGDWHAFKGSVFTTYRPIRFPGEPSNALHVVKPFAIPAYWPRILSIDWGKRAMCHAMWGAISPDHRAYVYREKAWYGKDIAIWASEIRDIHNEASEYMDHVTLCGSAWQDRGGDTVVDQFNNHSGLAASSSENSAGSRITGLQLVHEFLRWEPRVTLRSRGEFFDMDLAQKLYRLRGPEAYESYKSEFLDEEQEQNLPVLQIFETCPILVDIIPNAMYDETKTEDIAEFSGDDPLDNLRYFCKMAKRILAGEIGNIDHVQKMEVATRDLRMDGDMTKFYRRMEKIEDNMRSDDAFISLRRRGVMARRHLGRRHASIH